MQFWPLKMKFEFRQFIVSDRVKALKKKKPFLPLTVKARVVDSCRAVKLSFLFGRADDSYRPFPYSKEQQRQVEVRVDKNTCTRNLWNCPLQSRSGSIVRTYRSGIRESFIFVESWNTPYSKLSKGVCIINFERKVYCVTFLKTRSSVSLNLRVMLTHAI